MAQLKCQFPSCEYTIDRTDEFAAILFQSHVHGHSNGSTNHSKQQDNKVEKSRCPTINQNSTAEDWDFFESQWDDHKQLTKPSKQDISRILLQCCEPDLQKRLHRFHGRLGDKSEEEVLKKIKLEAVQIENVVMSRVTLQEMKQDRDESARSFTSRVLGQAKVCNYTTKFQCPCGCEQVYAVYYTDEQVRDVVVCGLADHDIRTDVLGDVNQETPLDKMVQIIETKEVSKKSATRLGNTHKISAIKSSYKREIRQVPHFQNNRLKSENKWNHSAKSRARPCNYCGNHGHENSRDYESRKKSCPAFNHTCKICNIKHHYEKVCRERHESHSRLTNTSNISTEYNNISYETEDQVGAINQPFTNQQD